MKTVLVLAVRNKINEDFKKNKRVTNEESIREVSFGLIYG